MAEAGNEVAGAAGAGRGRGRRDSWRVETRRRCIVTGDVRPKDELVRFVLGPDGVVVPDVAETLPGRGLWLTARRDIVDAACAKGLFAKAARRHTEAPADLADRVEALLAQRCLETLGLARRSGQVAVGSEKVRATLKAGKAAVLVAAGAAGGTTRLHALAPHLPLVTLLSGTELGSALGRDPLAYAALAPGRLAERLLREASRLAGFRAAAESGPRAAADSRRVARRRVEG